MDPGVSGLTVCTLIGSQGDISRGPLPKTIFPKSQTGRKTGPTVHWGPGAPWKLDEPRGDGQGPVAASTEARSTVQPRPPIFTNQRDAPQYPRFTDEKAESQRIRPQLIGGGTEVQSQDPLSCRLTPGRGQFPS